MLKHVAMNFSNLGGTKRHCKPLCQFEKSTTIVRVYLWVLIRACVVKGHVYMHIGKRLPSLVGSLDVCVLMFGLFKPLC